MFDLDCNWKDRDNPLAISYTTGRVYIEIGLHRCDWSRRWPWLRPYFSSGLF